MSKSNLGVAFVHEACPICGKKMNESILMNSKLTEKYAKMVEDCNNKCIGYGRDACEECCKYKDDAVFCIAIDEEKSKSNNPYRTGQIVGVRKDFPLFIENPEYVLKTDNGVSFCFIEESVGKQIGFFK